MKISTAIILITAILLSACVGVDGQPLPDPNAQYWRGVETRAAYDEGFMEGCLSTIFMLTPPQNLPPANVAVTLCQRIMELMKTEAQQPSTLPCTGNCT